ncbi:putative Tat pathway signal sequence [Rhypophila decipiens]|uniref:Tat pathway signal sequence n=1 Tax=Rhypophila decipiens TaxID=261697 RepID=A0AAN6Y8D8_9PEZI|nr:putative Tat pathway signal sequence [Rhypophila decipiens]
MSTTENKSLLKEGIGYSDDTDSNSSHHDEQNEHGHVKQQRYPPLKWWVYGGLIQVILMAIYTVIALEIIQASTSTTYGDAPDIHAFPGLIVRYKFRLYDNFINSPYTGAPTPESDLAWHNLLNNMSIRVSASELAAHNQTSVALPNGGYLAWLGVFHELHCVKILRQWSRRDHYFPEWENATLHEKNHQMVHIDHCIDWLRNAAVCRADTSALAVFKWDKRMPHPMLNTKRVNHRCVDWDMLMESPGHRERVVGKDEVVGLKNPLMEHHDD